MTMFELALLASLIAVFVWGFFLGLRQKNGLVRQRLLRAEKRAYNIVHDDYAAQLEFYQAERSNYLATINRLQKQNEFMARGQDV